MSTHTGCSSYHDDKDDHPSFERDHPHDWDGRKKQTRMIDLLARRRKKHPFGDDSSEVRDSSRMTQLLLGW